MNRAVSPSVGRSRPSISALIAATSGHPARSRSKSKAVPLTLYRRGSASSLVFRALGPANTNAADALDLLGLDEVGHLPTRSLSQGQRKRVALARLWLENAPRLWILDEPFTALDRDAVDQLCRRLEHHLASGGLVVYTTHQEITLGAGRMLQLDLGEEAQC